MWKDLAGSRELAWQLTVRDYKGQYRQSVLGVLWAFIMPVMNTLVWIFLNMTQVVKIPETGVPYLAYVFAGTMLWSVLVESINMPLMQTQAAKSIMGKINFPKEALLLSGFYKVLSNSLIKLALVLVIVLAVGIRPHPQMLFIPVGILALVVCGFSAGILVTPVGMLYNDVGRGIPLLMQFLMYLSPVVYFTPQLGSLAAVVAYNPLTPLIVNARNAFTGMPFENLPYFFILTGGMCLLGLAGWMVYRFSIPIIVERAG